MIDSRSRYVSIAILSESVRCTVCDCTPVEWTICVWCLIQRYIEKESLQVGRLDGRSSQGKVSNFLDDTHSFALFDLD